MDGERDLRTSDRRRGDALLTLVRRAVAAGDEVGKNNKTTLLLTMDWESLRDGLGAATTLGGLDAGTHLAPETVRRLCCDGSVIPVVLGSQRGGPGLGPREAVLHRRADQTAVAARRRLHLPGLRRAAAVDRRVTTSSTGQTSAPPTWPTPPCSASGTTRSCTTADSPAASSAARFGERVEWDLTRGSYDELLARRAAQEPA